MSQHVHSDSTSFIKIWTWTNSSQTSVSACCWHQMSPPSSTPMSPVSSTRTVQFVSGVDATDVRLFQVQSSSIILEWNCRVQSLLHEDTSFMSRQLLSAQVRQSSPVTSVTWNENCILLSDQLWNRRRLMFLCTDNCPSYNCPWYNCPSYYCPSHYCPSYNCPSLTVI